MEQLRLSLIRSNYPINLLNRLISEKPNYPKFSLSPQKIVYVGIKYYNNKSVKFAQRLAKIISKYLGLIKFILYFKTFVSYFQSFQPNKEPFPRHIHKSLKTSV